MSFSKLIVTLSILVLSLPAMGGLVPVELRCESQTNPMAIDVTSPRLSWHVQETVPGERGQRQTAYRILVASTPANIAADQGDLWDSGQVNSNRTTMIPYAGAALTTHRVCYWKVRVWDRTGQPSSWSSIHTWSMGLLNPSDWTAQWIGRDDAPVCAETNGTFTQANWIWYPEGNPAVSAPAGRRWFRREFVIPSGVTITQALVSITADNTFSLYVNGQAALAGADWKLSYQQNLSPLLTTGTNVLAVEVENSTNSTAYAGLLASVKILLSNGSSLTILTDSSWRAGNTQSANWHQRGFDASGWPSAMVLGSYGMSPWGSVGALFNYWSGQPATSAKTYLASTYLRKDFTLSQTPTRAVLYVTALGLIEPRLNGQAVGRDCFVPGWTEYSKRLYYQAYDVSALVHSGANTLGGILGDGWFRGNVGMDGQNKYGTKTRMRVQLRLTYGDGSTQDIVSDSSWKGGFGAILRSDLQDGETYDARREPGGWDTPGFNASAWQSVTTGAELTPALLQAHPGPASRRTVELTPVSSTQPIPGMNVYNFGQNFGGWARLKVTAPAGTVITLRFGEMLNADGTVYRDNLRGARQIDTYVCRGGGEELWEPRFTRHGFQYVEVTGLPQPATLAMLTGVSVNGDMPVTSSFQCSDPLINKIYTNTLWSQRANYTEVPMDCPQRDERLGWTGDAHIFIRTGAYNMDVNNFFAAWMDTLSDSQRPDGSFHHVAPVAFPVGASMAWIDAGIIIPWTLYEVYGDTRVLSKNYEAMARLIDYYGSKAVGYRIPATDQTYGDWLAVNSTTANDLISTAYYAHCVDTMASIADTLGKTADATSYRQLFNNIRNAFQAQYVAADGTVGTGSQTSYLMALKFNLLTEAQRAQASERLVADIQSRGDLLTTGFLGCGLLLPTLTDIGRTDVAYRLIQQTNYPSWGYSIAQGATTTWERWNSYTKADGFGDASMNSFNHYAYGACNEWTLRTVLGVDFMDPGFKTILIKPQPGGNLTSAQGWHDTSRGRISCSWTLLNNTFTLNVTIPANTLAEVHVPALDVASVQEGGSPATQANGLTYLRQEGATAVFQAQAGTYAFTSSLSGNWTAYNDCAWTANSSAIPSANDPAGDFTTYSPLAQVSGQLMHTNSMLLSAQVAFDTSAAAGFNLLDRAMTLPSGTDVERWFGGRIGTNCAVNWTSGSITMSFTGLETSKLYNIVIWSTRGGDSAAYSNRYTDVLIEGASSYVNLSSSGTEWSTQGAPNDRTRVRASLASGPVVRYDAINPGSDGAVQFKLTAGGDLYWPSGGLSTNGYLNGFALMVTTNSTTNTVPNEPVPSNAPAVFMAYDDCAWTADSTANPSGNDAPGLFTTNSPLGLHSGFVMNTNGQTLPIMATFDTSAASGLNLLDRAIAIPAGTDVERWFAGRIGPNCAANWTGGSVELTVSGLVSTGRYNVVLWSSRGFDSAAYSNRFTDITISGADAFTNRSSSGVVILTNAIACDRSRLRGELVPGRVARFDGINPGTDGTIKFTLTAGADLLWSAAASITNGYLNGFAIMTATNEVYTSTPPADATNSGWTAFNDMAWHNDAAKQGVESAPVNYTTNSPWAHTSGPLVDTNGNTLAAQVSFVYAGVGAPTLVDRGFGPPSGTPADVLFTGRIGTNNACNWTNGTVTMTVSSLNTGRFYTVALWSTRGAARWDYSNRWTDIVITNVRSFANTSTPGALKLTRTVLNDMTRVQASSDGHIARYDAIRPAANGTITFSIIANGLTAADANGYLNAFMLTEATTAADADVDGMDDTWETQYFGSPAAANGAAMEDWDGDGFNNYSEYRAGTDPAQASSLLEVTALAGTNAPNVLVLRWAGVTGKFYDVLATTNLAGAPWTAMGTGIPGVAPITTYTGSVGTAKVFWRVRVQ